MEKLFSPKLFTVLKKGYNKNLFTSDLFAGIIVGIVALPLAIAFAVAAGVSPERGLITAVIAGFLISLLGGSRVQIGGPTGAFIVIIVSIIQQYGFDGLLISTIMAGMFLVAFGLLKLGSLLKYIPHPLIVGFTSGIALTIFTTQIKDAFGLQIEDMPDGFLAKWGTYLSNLGQANIKAVLITVTTILISIFWKKVSTKIPGSFIAIIVITLIVWIFKIPVATIETVFGNISGKIEFTMPNIELESLSQYVGPALTIALLCAIESLLSAVVADGMISGHHRSNTELIAQGIANIVVPFFGGIPATGAIARTATNVRNGGKTPIAGIIHALVLLFIMLFLSPLAKHIPMSCLAGILIVVSYNMSEWRSFKSVLKGSKFDVVLLLVTFLLTVLVDLTVAIEIGIVLSALIFMKRMSDISGYQEQGVDSDMMEVYTDIPKGLGIYEISGPFFFGSAKEYCNIIAEIGMKSHVMIIRMRHVPFIDATGIINLRGVINTLQSSKTAVVLSGVNESVMADLVKNGIVDLVGNSHVFDNFAAALEHAKEEVKKY